MDFLDVWWKSFIFFFCFILYEIWFVYVLIEWKLKNAHILEPWFNSKQNCPNYSFYVFTKAKIFSTKSQFIMFVSWTSIWNWKFTILSALLGLRFRSTIVHCLFFFLSFHNKYLSSSISVLPKITCYRKVQCKFVKKSIKIEETHQFFWGKIFV